MPADKRNQTIWFRHFTMAPVLSGMLFVFLGILMQSSAKGIPTINDFGTSLISTLMFGWFIGIIKFGISTTASAFMQVGLHGKNLSRLTKVILIGACAALTQLFQLLTFAPVENTVYALTTIACVMFGATVVYICAPDD